MFIDTHCHLDADELGDAQTDVVQAADKAGVSRIVVPSVARANFGIVRELCVRYPDCAPAYGIHPMYTDGALPQDLAELREYLARPDAVAVGEIGLDFHWVEDSSQYPAQKKVLEYFLAASREQKKIVNLHTKGAEKEILDLLERYDIQRAIVHWYSGPLDILRALIEYGAYFTVGVEVLYSRSIHAIARELPMERLLTETDNPGGLKWLRGTIGMPQVIREVVQAIAELKQTTAETITKTVYNNFMRLTKDDPWLADIRARVGDS